MESTDASTSFFGSKYFPMFALGTVLVGLLGYLLYTKVWVPKFGGKNNEKHELTEQEMIERLKKIHQDRFEGSQPFPSPNMPPGPGFPMMPPGGHGFPMMPPGMPPIGQMPMTQQGQFGFPPSSPPANPMNTQQQMKGLPQIDGKT